MNKNVNNQKLIRWILRIAVAGEFAGHSFFALQGKKAWIGWIQQLTGADISLAGQLLFAIGLVDLSVALIVLLKPIRIVLLWAAVWGFWTALVRPLVGEPIWDFVERSTNWGAPLALLLAIGLPKTIKDWFR